MHTLADLVHRRPWVHGKFKIFSVDSSQWLGLAKMLLGELPSSVSHMQTADGHWDLIIGQEPPKNWMGYKGILPHTKISPAARGWLEFGYVHDGVGQCTTWREASEAFSRSGPLFCFSTDDVSLMQITMVNALKQTWTETCWTMLGPPKYQETDGSRSCPAGTFASCHWSRKQPSDVGGFGRFVQEPQKPTHKNHQKPNGAILQQPCLTNFDPSGKWARQSFRSAASKSISRPIQGVSAPLPGCEQVEVFSFFSPKICYPSRFVVSPLQINNFFSKLSCKFCVFSWNMLQLRCSLMQS